jgi:hypothetical protein
MGAACAAGIGAIVITMAAAAAWMKPESLDIALALLKPAVDPDHHGTGKEDHGVA